MVRQDVETMILEGFRLLDNYQTDGAALVVVPTRFGKMGELDGVEEDWNEEAKPARKKVRTASSSTRPPTRFNSDS
jgi:hypothetical protein